MDCQRLDFTTIKIFKIIKKKKIASEIVISTDSEKLINKYYDNKYLKYLKEEIVN